MATTTCIHGFQPGQCLICQTLQNGKEQGRRRSGPAPVPSPRPVPAAPSNTAVHERPAPRRSLAWRAGVLVLCLALVVVLAGWIAGLAFTILRSIELAVTALVAGWIGYRIGVYRGRHLGD